jgi:hypothetical protein
MKTKKIQSEKEKPNEKSGHISQIRIQPIIYFVQSSQVFVDLYGSEWNES